MEAQVRRNSSVVSGRGFDPEKMKRRVTAANGKMELEHGGYEHQDIKY